ncbi:hypothetical protein [Pseudonocardia sp. GCM10023141]|uniref:hypothetical protein n=1 Tax=Pseudonocardia sp. GCM10023141 TaxID=3252653 RepID=UPI00361026F0
MAAPVRVRPAPGIRVPPPSRIAERVVRGALFGVLAGGLVFVGRLSGVLDGFAGLAVAVLLVLLVPMSRELSRRVLLGGALVLGWTQVGWWWALPVGSLGRVTLALTVLAAALGAWVGAGARPAGRARLLLPRVRLVDLLVPGSAGFGAVVLLPWLQGRSAMPTLGLLMTGWDHSAHFSMVHMIRTYGVTVDALPPPPGGTWQFATYPQGYHTVVASIMELLAGPRVGSIEAELVGYTQAIALLLIVLVAVLVSGFCALPALRSRPAIVAPVAAFAAAVIYLGPGAPAIQGGFGNFVFACVLVVVLALIAVPLARICTPLHLAAMGGAVIGVASGWVLLLALAGPAVLVVLLPLRRSRWRASWPRTVGSVLVVAAVLGGLLRIAAVVLRVQAADPLLLTGGIVRPGIGWVAVSVLATLGACVLMIRRGSGSAARIAALGLVPLVGAATAVVLALMQVRASGTITYYGVKFMTGLVVVLLPLLMVPVAVAVAERLRGRSASGFVAGGRRFVGAACLALAATQIFGLAAPDRTAIGLPSEAPGASNRAAQLRVLDQPQAPADLVERVVHRPAGTPAEHVFFLDVPSDRHVDPLVTTQWYFALTDSWTYEDNTLAGRYQLTDPTPETLTNAVRGILAARPDTFVALRSEEVGPLRLRLDDPALGARVIGI